MSRHAPSQLTLALRDLPPPFKRNSDTSIAAAKEVRPRAPGYRAIILGYLKGRGATGATAEEISDALQIRLQTVTPRIVELREQRSVVASGFTRPTKSMRQAVVWVAA